MRRDGGDGRRSGSDGAPSYRRPEEQGEPRRQARQEGDAPRRRPRPAPEQAASHAFFVPCPKGLEAELVNELAEMGITDARPAPGGAAFKGTLPEAWRVNLWSRLAVRVLWRVGEGRYQLESDLYDGALKVDWPALFEVSRTIAVHAVARHSPLKSLNFVALKVKDAVCDRFRAECGERPSVDTHAPDIPLVLYLTEERYSLYIDLSGEPLNRRGFRVEPAAAPLNENLAAGLLRLSGWRPGTPFFDPMMGGGTLLIEAAMMWLHRAPGLKRHFAFENLKGFQRIEWQRLRKDAEAVAHEPESLPIFGADIDPAMVRATGLNLKAADLLDCVQLLEADFLEVDAPPVDPGVIVSNPPYGVRLSLEDMAAFYKAMGDVLKRKYPGWSAYLISADPELPKHIGLSASRRTPLFNGPLECRFYAYRLVAGSNRR
jgi:putative N6-adenine-specific DNA methylase